MEIWGFFPQMDENRWSSKTLKFLSSIQLKTAKSWSISIRTPPPFNIFSTVPGLPGLGFHTSGMEGKHKQASNWSRLGSTWWKLDSTQAWWLNGKCVGLLTVNVEFLLWHHDSQNQNKSHMQDCMSLQWSQMSRSWGFVEPLVQVHSQNLSNLTNHCLPFGFAGFPTIFTSFSASSCTKIKEPEQKHGLSHAFLNGTT